MKSPGWRPVLAALFLLAAWAARGAAQDAPALTGLTVSQGRMLLWWESELDRYIVEQVDLRSGQLTAVGTSSGRLERVMALNPDETTTGFYRIHAGLQAFSVGDPLLEAAIRSAVGSAKQGPTNWLYDADVAGLTQLNLALQGISTLAGAGSLFALRTLDAGGNALSGLDPLDACKDLQAIRAEGNALASLAGLEALTNMALLDVSHNELTDLDPLSGLAALNTLYADHNQLAALDALAGLTHLAVVDVSANQITSIAPLLQNASQGGLGAGDQVYLSGNPLVNTGEVAELRGYGVSVVFP